MPVKYRLMVILFVTAIFLLTCPVVADEIIGDQAEPKNYCNDLKTWAIFEGLCAKYPDDEAVQTLHALRIGLCKKVEDGSITLPLAVDIFDRVHQIVLKDKKAKEEVEDGPGVGL